MTINWDPSYQSKQSFEATMEAAGWRRDEFGHWTKTTQLVSIPVEQYEAEIAKSDAENEKLRTELAKFREQTGDVAHCRLAADPHCDSCRFVMEAWRDGS